MASNLTQDLDKPKGLGKLNGFLAPKSYVVGYYPSKEDADLFKELSKHWGSGPDAKFAHARRWWAHINSFSEDERNSWTSPEVKQKHTEQKKEEHKPQEHKKEEEKKRKRKNKMKMKKRMMVEIFLVAMMMKSSKRKRERLLKRAKKMLSLLECKNRMLFSMLNLILRKQKWRNWKN